MYYKTVYWFTLSPNILHKVHLSIKVQSNIFCDTSQQIQYTVHVRVLKLDTLQFQDIPMFLYIKFIPNNITITQSQCYQSAHFETRIFLLLKAQTWTLIPQDHKNNLFLAFLHFSIKTILHFSQKWTASRFNTLLTLTAKYINIIHHLSN